ncbi:NAD-dependent protein deacetylase [Peribacillus frigoritolerans]|uniref:NAD-dependent protein deacetylase n=1 Tax=Peribacillus frigoritolerans TaxID=450367 RepID=UPI000FDC68EC|nr:NAD-dependent protein deacetylase [Peribacillus frigoritolerans]AZV59446.1 NAD-dependent protein deacetylase [Peribacillus frigoritolerans]
MLSQQYQENIDTLLKKIQEAEAIVVGGAAGMTEAAGLSSYKTDENFLKYFGKFADKYGIKNIFEGFYYPFSSSEERWAFLSTDIKFIYEAEAGRPYLDLVQLLQGKDYFIVTTNQDSQFSKVFPEEKVSPIQGDMRYFQCGSRCHDQVYFNKEQVENMYANIEGTRIPTELIPLCPKCGHEMEPWVRSYVFLEGTSYRNELTKYNEYLLKNKDKKVLFLELGVGTMTPMFIKEPFWNMTYSWPDVYYITINPKDALLPRELKDKGLAIHEDIALVLQDAVNEKAKRHADIE